MVSLEPREPRLDSCDPALERDAERPRLLVVARRLVLDAEELVEHALPVRALVLEPLRRLGRLEQPEKERAQRCVAAYAAIRLALAQPAAHLRETDGP